MNKYETLPVKRLSEDAVIPQYAHGADEDAGLDLYAAETLLLSAFKPTLVSTGIAIELPPGYEGQVRPRSGLAVKHGVTVINAPGTIDPGYRGEIKVGLVLIGHPNSTYRISKGDRIAQLVIAAYQPVVTVEARELSESIRGSEGFGSTGRGRAVKKRAA